MQGSAWVRLHLNDEVSWLVFRYGVEPPVLVKLEKEIELEETLLNTSGPEDSISIPKSCCQHEELHEAVSSCYTFDHDGVHLLDCLVMLCSKENVSYLEYTLVLTFTPWWVQGTMLKATFYYCVWWGMELRNVGAKKAQSILKGTMGHENSLILFY